eukprot:gene6853-7622_t
MAEPKRAPLLPVTNEVTTPQDEPGATKSPESEQEETYRFEISLTDSTEKGCLEFSYHQKIKSKLKKSAKLDHSKSLDPFHDDDDDDNEKLKALAKKFEDKYGPKQGESGKKRKHASDAFYDIGSGYDETDNFVDNSEAYDELIPSNWTTRHGGFYINQGELHFKPMSEEDSKDFKSPKKKKHGPENKKMKIKHDDKSISKTPKELSTQKRKKQLLSNEKHKKKLENAVLKQKEKKQRKKAHLDSQTTPQKAHIKSSQAKKATNELLSPKTAKVPQNDSVLNSADLSYGESSFSTSPTLQTLKEVYTKANNAAKAKETEVIAKQFLEDVLTGAHMPDNASIATSKVGQICDNATDKSMDISPKDGSKDGEQTGPPQLPDNLPLILEAGIQNLKEAARNCSNGKCRFFDMSVNKILLSVARCLAKLPCKLRTTAYDYLAYYLPCSKETLIKRAKTLMIEHQVNQLDEPMKNLKDAIERVMPQQKKLFDAAVANALTEQVREQMKQSGFPSKADTESSEDQLESPENLNANEQPITPTESNGKKNIPKRKFSWTDEIRDLLCEVVAIKVQLYKMLKSRSMTAEEYIKDFLENDVRKLWPKGWMTSRNKAKKAAKKPEQAGSSVTPNKDSSLLQSSSMSCSSSITSTSQLPKKTSDNKIFHYPSKTPQAQKPATMSITKPFNSPPIKSLSQHVPTTKTANNNALIYTKFEGSKTSLPGFSTKSPDTKNANYQLHGSFSGQAVSSKKPGVESIKHEVVGRSLNSVSLSKPGIQSTIHRGIDANSSSGSMKNYASPTIKKEPNENMLSILDYAAVGSVNSSEKSSALNRPNSTGHARSTELIKPPKPVLSMSHPMPERGLSYLKSEVPVVANIKLHTPGSSKKDDATVSAAGARHCSSKSTSHSLLHQNNMPSSSSHGAVNSSVMGGMHTKVITPPKRVAVADGTSMMPAHMITPPKHATSLSQSPLSPSAFSYKTPPRCIESQKSKSVTPPKNSLIKNISPQQRAGISSNASVPQNTRTSPLVHYPTAHEHGSRMSGHSPEIRRSPIGISYSVSR